jgi:magnesium-transporting ATPase (P-type)
MKKTYKQELIDFLNEGSIKAALKLPFSKNKKIQGKHVCRMSDEIVIIDNNIFNQKDILNESRRIADRTHD